MNLIKGVSAGAQNTAERWALRLALVVGIVLAVWTGWLLYEWHTLSEGPTLEQVREQEHALHMQSAGIAKRTVGPAYYLRAIAHAIPDDAYLTKLTVSSKGALILEGSAANRQAVTHFVKNLSVQEHVRNIRLNRIMRDAGRVSFVIHAQTDLTSGLVLPQPGLTAALSE